MNCSLDLKGEDENFDVKTSDTFLTDRKCEMEKISKIACRSAISSNPWLLAIAHFSAYLDVFRVHRRLMHIFIETIK